MKNQKVIIGAVVGILLIVGGGFFVMSSNKKAAPAPVEETPAEEQVVAISPEEIGLSLEQSSDNRKVILEVTNTEGLAGLDYELSYIAKGELPRGVIGHIDVKQAGKAVRQEITLGTCSDVCHYDEDVSNIKLILKVTKTDGTVSQAEKVLED